MKKVLAAVCAAALSMSLCVFSAINVSAAQTVTVGEGGKYADFTALTNAFNDGSLQLAAGDTIKLASDLTMTGTMEIPSGVDIKFDMNGKTITSEGFIGRPFKILSGAKVEVYGNGTITSDTYGAFDVYGELIVRDGTYKAHGCDKVYTHPDTVGGGAVLRTRPGSKLEVCDGVYVKSEHSGAVYSEGELICGACTLVSDSSNTQYDIVNGETVQCKDTWAYCAQAASGKATFNNTTVDGVQGGLYIGGDVIVNGGTYGAYDRLGLHNAFYGIYVSNGATAVINGNAKVVAGNYNYALLNGDNDVGMELGKPVTINSGTFEGKVGSQNNSTYGIQINGGTFKDIVVSGDVTLREVLAGGKNFEKQEDGYYKVVDAAVISSDGGFDKVSDSGEVEENQVGQYFNVTTQLDNTVSKAIVTFDSQLTSKTLKGILDLSSLNISGEGDIGFSILLVGAPKDVTAQIVYR